MGTFVDVDPPPSPCCVSLSVYFPPIHTSPMSVNVSICPNPTIVNSLTFKTTHFKVWTPPDNDFFLIVST